MSFVASLRFEPRSNAIAEPNHAEQIKLIASTLVLTIKPSWVWTPLAIRETISFYTLRGILLTLPNASRKILFVAKKSLPAI